MEWTRGPTIGRGSSATVSLATTSSGDLFAVKSTDLSRSSFLQREQHFLSQLSSLHVIKFMGFDVTYENNKAVYNLFMEYAHGGSISDVIKKQGGSLDESTARSYTSQILQGLDYLHSNNLVHCDIKGQNILIGKDCIKIGDLGCAKLVDNGGTVVSSALSGTPVFMAPEVARGEEQGFPADVWALGCTLIEMATGSSPWPELDDPVSALYRIGYSGDLPEIPKWLSDEAKDFLGNCLNRDPNERWTIKELLQHPFIDKLEPDLDKTEELLGNSPTSILDQGFWDSLEGIEPFRDPTKSDDLPVDRIRQLIGLESDSPSLSNWGDDDDEHWVTIRNNQIDEIPTISEWHYENNSDENELTRVDSFVLSVDYEEGFQSSIRNNEVLFDSENSSVRSSIRSDLHVIYCETVDHISVLLNKINGKYILISSGIPRPAYTLCSIWDHDSFQVNKINGKIILVNSGIPPAFFEFLNFSRDEYVSSDLHSVPEKYKS